MNDSIKPLRERIDALDAQILDLVNQRARVACEIGAIKHQASLPVYAPEREAEVLAALAAANPGPLPADSVKAIYREVMAACRALEKRERVAFLGPVGTYSEQALRRQFGHAVEAVPCASIDEVFRLAESGDCAFGVVPVENSTEGVVSRTLDLMLRTPLKICAEIGLPINHWLLTATGTMDGITRIVSHPQSLAQCQNWLNNHFPALPRNPVSSNGEAARLASVEPGAAAIAGETAAQLYGLKAVATNIQDELGNTTRFAVIGNVTTRPSKAHDATALIVSVRNEPGAVHKLLEPLARHNVSMTRFESRPNRQRSDDSPWTYHFYIDIEGHQGDPRIAPALAELQSLAGFFKILGSYPVQ